MFFALQHLNDLSLRIDLEEALKHGEAVYLQLLENKDKLPNRILEILGLPVPEDTADASTSSELQKSFAHVSIAMNHSGKYNLYRRYKFLCNCLTICFTFCAQETHRQMRQYSSILMMNN